MAHKKPRKPVRKLPVPFINTGLDDSKVIIKYPKDPLQIGTAVVNGNPQPIWLDPKDLVMTPALKEEQADNMKGQALASSDYNAQMEVAALVEAWLQRCLIQLVPATIDINDQALVKEWCDSNGVDFYEPPAVAGVVKFILRRKGRVVSEFVAKLSKPQAQAPVGNN